MITKIEILGEDMNLVEYERDSVELDLADVELDLEETPHGSLFLVQHIENIDSLLITTIVDEVLDYIRTWESKRDTVINIQVFESGDYIELLKYLGELNNIYLKEEGEESALIFAAKGLN